MFRVLKFGGSSVADATAMSRVLDIVGPEMEKGRVVLVCSAISGCTDALLAFAAGDASGIPALRSRHLGIVRRLFTGTERTEAETEINQLFEKLEAVPDNEKVTFGELLSTRIIARKLACDGYRTSWLDSRQLIIKGDRAGTEAQVQAALAASEADIFVAPGFIAGTPEGGVTTLGRGGSDYSAALYAAACQADSLQIWTDVPGIMTANPKTVPAARTIPEMSYGAALQMAEHGAKVLYAPTVAPALEAGIAIEIRNTFDPQGRYTLVTSARDADPWIGVTAATPGEIFLIGTPEADFTVARKQVGHALAAAGIAALEVCREGDNLRIAVRPGVGPQALQALHRSFFETAPVTTLHLFIAGYGAVGKALVDMVGRSADTVARRTGKTLRIAGLADSRRHVIDLGGIVPAMAANRLARGGAGDFPSAVCALAPKGSVFVDCTDSETLYRDYAALFRAGVNIVSSNRRSFAVPYVDYAALHAAARQNGVFFRYETTVGAALPMLSSIAAGANSCDEMVSIEAVVSCTLNQILSAYGSGVPLVDLVRAAQEAGLTETDPRMDLGGRDALRKLLILAREAGVHLEEDDVEIEPLIPRELLSGSLEDFYRGLTELEPTFAEASAQAARQGCRQRFTAYLEKTETGWRAGIQVRLVPREHPAYHLRGTENAIIIRSAFHPYPLVIEGAGEGAVQAASSVLNDILR
ncbi:MAG: aspartate kinase [Bacteroidales bacterium]|nr:aspartate kinase [Bacteroidales bacterium]